MQQNLGQEEMEQMLVNEQVRVQVTVLKLTVPVYIVGSQPSRKDFTFIIYKMISVVLTG